MKKAFTLVEVLITITIIGIIAAMVLPQLITSQFEDEMVNKLKKEQSILSQAVESATRTHGIISDWGGDVSNFYSIISPQLKIVESYNTTASNCSGSGAFATSWRTLKGETKNDLKQHGYGCMANFKLADGTSVGLKSTTNDSSNRSMFGVANQLFSGSKFILILLDLNGKDEPNMLGRDMFFFVLTDRGIIPAGVDSTSNCSETGAGRTCAAKVLNEKAMNY